MIWFVAYLVGYAVSWYLIFRDQMRRSGKLVDPDPVIDTMLVTSTLALAWPLTLPVFMGAVRTMAKKTGLHSR